MKAAGVFQTLEAKPAPQKPCNISGLKRTKSSRSKETIDSISCNDGRSMAGWRKGALRIRHVDAYR